MPRVTQFQLRAFFKAEHLWAKKSLEKEAVTPDKTPPISQFPCLNILLRFSHTSWKQRKKQNVEHLAVMWGSGRFSGEIRAALLNLKGAEGSMCWCCGVTFCIRKPPILETKFCPALYISAKINVPSWNFWKPKQCMARLLLCKERSGPQYFWRFPLVCNSLCQYELFFSSLCLFASPNTSWIHDTGMSHGSKKGIKRETHGPGQQGWVSAWLDHLSWPVRIKKSIQCPKWK